MLCITNSDALERALTLPLPDAIRDLLLLRRDQLAGHARFVLFQAGDRPRWLEDALGFSIFQNIGDGTWSDDPEFTPGWEHIEDHGFAIEATWIFDDSGFAHVLIVLREHGVNRPVLDFCARYARQDA